MTYDASNCHRSGDVDDLRYEVTTLEGFTSSFTPESQGLHVCKIKMYVMETYLALRLLTIKLSSEENFMH